MRRFLTLTLCICITIISAFIAPRWATADEGGKWLLGYAGMPAGSFIWDERSPELLREIVPEALLTQVTGALAGPADDVQVEHRRYVSLSACSPRSCYQKAFLWMDTGTGSALSAYAEAPKETAPPFAGRALYTVTLASKSFGSNHIPATAERAVKAWLAAWDIRATTVRFIGPGGTLTLLDDWSDAAGARSLAAQKTATVEVVNHLPSPVEVFWRDYQGDEHLYGTLEPGEHQQLATFVTHPWIVRSIDTHDALASVVAASHPERVVVSDDLSSDEVVTSGPVFASLAGSQPAASWAW